MPSSEELFRLQHGLGELHPERFREKEGRAPFEPALPPVNVPGSVIYNERVTSASSAAPVGVQEFPAFVNTVFDALPINGQRWHVQDKQLFQNTVPP